MLLALPLGLTGSLNFLPTGSTDLVECARQKDYPITFPFFPFLNVFCGFITRWICEIDPTDLGNIPLGVQGSRYKEVNLAKFCYAHFLLSNFSTQFFSPQKNK